MNSKILLLSLVLGILLLNLASAEVTTTVNAFYAEIQEDGSVSYTDVPVSNFQTVGYVCLNSDCSSVGQKIDGLTKTSSGNSVTLKFPTTLQNPNGYGIWFYKDGYIHWEQKADFYGNRVIDEPLDIYLTRKAIGWAPIMDMHVVNEVHPNIPVEVGVEVGIDADTYSAIENAGPLDYNPVELDSVNVVRTNVSLKIKNSSGNVVYSDHEILEVPYSDYETVNFTYSGFSQTGVYNVELSTEILDDKILDSLSQFARTEIRVIPYGLTDFSFSLISGLSMNPVSPEKNENIDFSFNYDSEYVNEFGVLNPLDTNVSIRIYQDGEKISEVNSTKSKTENYFEFSESFSDLGDYTIIVEGMPAVCLGANGCLPSLQEISFIIKDNIPADTIAPQITILSPIDGETYNSSNVLVSVVTDENAEVWFKLNNGADVPLGSGTSFEYNLTGLTERTYTLSVYAKDSSNNLRVVSISFSVDLGGDDDGDDGDSTGRHREIEYGESVVSEVINQVEIDDTPIKITLTGEKSGFNFWYLFWIFLILVLILIILKLSYRRI